MRAISHVNHGAQATRTDGTVVSNVCFFLCVAAITGKDYETLFREGGFLESDRGHMVDTDLHAEHISRIATANNIRLAFYTGVRPRGTDSICVADASVVFPMEFNTDGTVTYLGVGPIHNIVCIHNHYMTFVFADGASDTHTTPLVSHVRPVAPTTISDEEITRIESFLEAFANEVTSIQKKMTDKSNVELSHVIDFLGEVMNMITNIDGVIEHIGMEVRHYLSTTLDPSRLQASADEVLRLRSVLEDMGDQIRRRQADADSAFVAQLLREEQAASARVAANLAAYRASRDVPTADAPPTVPRKVSVRI
jgi:hypothetical protein